MMRSWRWMVIGLVGLLMVIGGCASDPTSGYALGGLYDDDVQTVSVPIFQNRTFYRELEFELTDAVIKTLQKRTPYRIGPPRGADRVLEGEIVDVDLEQLSRSRTTGLSEEQVISVTIDFRWKDPASGATLVERRGFTGHGLFVPSAPTGEPIELGRFAAVERLAEDLVSELRGAW